VNTWVETIANPTVFEEDAVHCCVRIGTHLVWRDSIASPGSFPAQLRLKLSQQHCTLSFGRVLLRCCYCS